MYVEIKEAVNFISRYLYSKIPRRKVNLFTAELANFFVYRFQQHWSIIDTKRDESKCIIEIKRGGHTDTLISCACSAVGLELEEVLRHISNNLTITVNPGAVCFQIGDGPLTTIWSGSVDVDDQPSAQMTMSSSSATLFGGIQLRLVSTAGRVEDRSLLLHAPLTLAKSSAVAPDRSNWLVFHSDMPMFELSTPHEVKYSVGTFAFTRFGAHRPRPDHASLRQIQRKAALAVLGAMNSGDHSSSSNESRNGSLSPESDQFGYSHRFFNHRRQVNWSPELRMVSPLPRLADLRLD